MPQMAVSKRDEWGHVSSRRSARSFAPTNIGEWPAQSQARALAALDNDTSIPVMLDWEKEKWFKNGKVVREFNPTFDDDRRGRQRDAHARHQDRLAPHGHWLLGPQCSPTLAGHGLDLVNARWGSNPEAKVAADHYPQTTGGVATCPPTVDVLAGKVDTWRTASGDSGVPAGQVLTARRRAARGRACRRAPG